MARNIEPASGAGRRGFGVTGKKPAFAAGRTAPGKPPGDGPAAGPRIAFSGAGNFGCPGHAALYATGGDVAQPAQSAQALSSGPLTELCNQFDPEGVYFLA